MTPIGPRPGPAAGLERGNQKIFSANALPTGSTARRTATISRVQVAAKFFGVHVVPFQRLFIHPMLRRPDRFVDKIRSTHMNMGTPCPK